MPVKTHWKALAETRFIGAHTLPNGDDLVVTIESAARERHTMDDGKESDYIVLYLVGQKPMILNATNGKTIHKMYGAYIEDWQGKQITLFQGSAILHDELVECLRVRPVPPRQQKEPISNTRFKRALLQIKAGQYTAAKLRETHSLTAQQNDAINNLSSPAK